MNPSGLLQVAVLLCRLVLRLVVASIAWVLEAVFPPPERSVEGTVTLITGGGGSLGRELAVQLALEGGRVVLCDVEEERLRCSGVAVQAVGGDVALYRCDVTSPSSVTEMANRVQLEVGRVDWVVHCAALHYRRAFLEHSEEQLNGTVGVTLGGAMAVTQAFLGPMVEGAGGHVVLVAPLLWGRGTTPHCAAQGAVTGFSEALSAELRALGTRGVGVSLVRHLEAGGEGGPLLLKAPTTEETAGAIVTALKRGPPEIFLPWFLGPLHKLTRSLPIRMRQVCQGALQQQPVKRLKS